MAQPVIYRIVDEDEGENTPEITVQNRTLTAISRTLYYRRQIPEGGFQLDDFLAMAEQMEVDPGRLLNSLFSHLDIDNAVLLLIQLQLMNGGMNVVFVVGARSPPEHPAPRLNVLNDPPEDTCAICLETSSATPGQGWATAEGCDTHRFHAQCIRGWRGGTCPMCRVPLRE
jgi:hypothetical protein